MNLRKCISVLSAVGIITAYPLCLPADKSVFSYNVYAAKNISGDANGDGKLNVRDCAYIASALANGTAGSLPSNADYNNDGVKNVRDAAAIAKHLAGSNISEPEQSGNPHGFTDQEMAWYNEGLSLCAQYGLESWQAEYYVGGIRAWGYGNVIIGDLGGQLPYVSIWYTPDGGTTWNT